ncbi:MAG: hypothetical protein F6K18_17185 [Okeania sp. SIO2C2]|uniref:hypothetical protein n=1 Tax=Okeania sp. SIO2C2 TaxID=2607787 RepID=UPI0013BB02D8|nr:hypothetical protein [Okeania sp. SIO2C2]NEP88421.1 hypothetical protein [Okeania sp. SIO2C2]
MAQNYHQGQDTKLGYIGGKEEGRESFFRVIIPDMILLIPHFADVVLSISSYSLKKKS